MSETHASGDAAGGSSDEFDQVLIEMRALLDEVESTCAADPFIRRLVAGELREQLHNLRAFLLLHRWEQGGKG